MKYTNRWEMPEVTFYQVEDHGFSGYGDRPLFAYGPPGATDDRGIPKTGELHEALDRALVAWVAEKYTGPRGAGGTGVDTAAGWFMRMIGADTLVPVEHPEGQKVLQDVIADTRKYDGPIYQRARAMETELADRGLVIAKMNTR